MKKSLAILLIHAVSAINFNISGSVIPFNTFNTTELTPFNQFSVNWRTVDPFIDTNKFTGAFMITVAGQANNCGGAILKTWDMDGTNSSATPDLSLPVYGITSGRCFFNMADQVAIQKNIINQTVTTSLPVVFKRYENTKSNPGFSIYTNVSSIMFANVRMMDIAIIKLNLMVKDVIGILDFYPITKFKQPAGTSVSVVTYFDPYESQIHYQRASYNSILTSNETFAFNNGNLNNKYAFGHTATFKSTGAPVLVVDPTTGKTQIVGVAVEEGVTPPDQTTTKNYGTWASEITYCFTPIGMFSLNQPKCLNTFAIDYLFTTGFLLVAPKNLIKTNTSVLTIGPGFNLLSYINNPRLYVNVTPVYAVNQVSTGPGQLSTSLQMVPVMSLVFGLIITFTL